MPNINQIRAFREKYAVKNSVSKTELKLLAENFNQSIGQIKNQFSRSGIDQAIIDYFESQKSAQVILLFIDITDFSTKCNSYTNSRLSSYLDEYYEKVIATIYRHGGEIEKIIGDGIICIFGQPFLKDSKSDLFTKADACAKDIIMDLKESDMEVKVAMHDGNIMYYKNKTENYPEYTMIGKPLTELFRLETVSENNAINYYHISDFN